MAWWLWLIIIWGALLLVGLVWGLMASRGFFMDETHGTAPKPPRRTSPHDHDP